MKNQKSLGNKGFSLVELIVVIAIMAVLMGVLAPTLIGNIEKSRESKDLQNLDSVYQAINTAMAEEKVVKEVAGTNSEFKTAGTFVELSALSATKSKFLKEELEKILGPLSELDLSATCNASAKIYISINASTQKAIVRASTDGKAATVCEKTEDASGAKRAMEVE